MQCYDSQKYRLLGYSKALSRYVLTDRDFDDREICVKEAIIKANNKIIAKLSEGNPNDLVAEIDFLEMMKSRV